MLKPQGYGLRGPLGLTASRAAAALARSKQLARFMGIAEQMGRVLQRTSISVNIKERLDFSCALFGPDGG
jgi:5-oxoprolinase (ATP-hydrolysing)